MSAIDQYSNWRIASEKANQYFGRQIDLRLSSNPKKKYMIYNPEKKKWIHFGAMGYQDYTKHHDEQRRDRYLKRATALPGNWKHDKYSPNNLSIHILW
jgi:hypothetical protein